MSWKKKTLTILDCLILSLTLIVGLKGWKVGVQQVEAVWEWKSSLPTNIPSYGFTKDENVKNEIVVALVDTGIDATHPDIAPCLWKNPGEIANDGLDNDGNGFIDDVIGWDFTKDKPLPIDEHGHGTHIAGIIKNVSGEQPKLMILKYYSEAASGKDNLKNSLRALQYAVSQNVHIINYSGGGPQSVEQEYKILKQAELKGILVVAAAGNEGIDVAEKKYFPASYDLKNILSVASISSEKKLSNTSNFGQRIDIAAPGEDIYSTLPLSQGGYGMMTGTSQSTAFISGIAVFVLSKRHELLLNRNQLATSLIKVIKSKASQSKALQSKVQAGAIISKESI